MDRYFYTIEFDGQNNKFVHMCGNIYFNDAYETETNYRCAEWTGMSFSLSELRESLDNRELFNELCDGVKYLEDMTKEEALRISNIYFGNETVNHLPICNVDQETPCGCYWFDGDEMYKR